MNAARIVLLALASLRATRFITSDHLGEWWIVGPAKRWAWRNEGPKLIGGVAIEDPQSTPPAHYGWRSKLVHGLDCAACVGFWLGALVLVAELLTGPRGPLRILRPVWTFVASIAALNYVVFHISSRID